MSIDPSAKPKPRKVRQRNFRPSDMDKMAVLLAKRFTETRACAYLGFHYGSYKDWKYRKKNSSKVIDALARAEAAQMAGHLANIEDFEIGNGVKRDWRASEALLKIKFPELYQAGQPNAPAITVNIAMIEGACDQVLKLANAGKTKLIDAPATVCDNPVTAKEQAGQS